MLTKLLHDLGHVESAGLLLDRRWAWGDPRQDWFDTKLVIQVNTVLLWFEVALLARVGCFINCGTLIVDATRGNSVIPGLLKVKQVALEGIKRDVSSTCHLLIGKDQVLMRILILWEGSIGHIHRKDRLSALCGSVGEKPEEDGRCRLRVSD